MATVFRISPSAFPLTYIMSDNNGPRKPVKATYAHKKSRSTKAQLDPVALSSPFQSLDSVAQGSDTVYASNAEMTRRMLKRSHHATKNDKVPQPTEVDRKAKRTKHSIAPIALNSIINEEYSMSLNDLRPIDHSDATQFQTPFGEAYVHPSAISKPLVQEQMSPIPIANRILSRTSSRNLKENSASKSASSKGLASPFASRHSSANSSPRSKNRSKSRPKQNSRISRPALTTKSHSTTSSHNQNNSHSQSQFHTYLQEPYLSTNQSARASPDRLPDSKSITRNRYPSSHTLTQIPPQDWLVPPKALSKQSREDNDDVDMHTPPDFGVAVGSSSFLANSPMAFSTPLPPRERHRQAVTRAENDPGSGISTRGSLEFSPHALIINPNFDDNNGDDVMITNSSRKIPRAPSQKILHISGNSIFSSSGDFTLAQTQNSAVPSPFSSKHARISKSSKTLNDSIFQSNNDISQNESLEVTSSQSHSKPKESIPEHDIALYQLTSPAPLRLSSPAPQDRSSSFLDELMAAPIPMPTPMSSPKGVPVGTDAINIYPENPEGLLNDLFDDMVFDGTSSFRLFGINLGFPAEDHGRDKFILQIHATHPVPTRPISLCSCFLRYFYNALRQPSCLLRLFNFTLHPHTLHPTIRMMSRRNVDLTGCGSLASLLRWRKVINIHSG